MRNPSLLLLIPFLVAATEPPGDHSVQSGEWTTARTEPYPKKRDDIVFVDRALGFYGTGRGNLYRTDDGGISWREVWRSPGTFIRALAFLDRKRGFLGNLGTGFPGNTDPTPFYRTEDGGRTWTPVVISGGTVDGICSIDVLRVRAIHEGDVGERVIVHAAGRANGPAKLLRSEDGGATWRLIDLSGRAGMILDVKFIDPNTGFVFAGSNGDLARSNALILKTTDGGWTWREVYRSDRLQEIVWKASFADDTNAFATLQNDDPANAQQRVLRTTDRGENWVELPLVNDAKAQEFGIGFETPQHGWVGTAVGGFETRDGGETWKPSNLAPRANKIRVRASDGSRLVYAIGTEVQMLFGSNP